MSDERLKLEPSWKARLGDYFDRPDMHALSEFLRAEKHAGKRIYPPGPEIFAAMDATPFEAVKVVILGQDPYHGPGQAHGLCFSVRPGVPVPPSLQNIFSEIEGDLGIARPDHGCLTPWTRRGVLLLNSVLTVQAGMAGAHQGKGWEGFTDKAIDELNRGRDGLVFLLWGSYAQAKGKLIGRVMTEAMPNGATPKASSGTVSSKPAANGLRTVLNFQRVGTQRYFDAAGFPGRTLGLEVDGGKQKTAGK